MKKKILIVDDEAIILDYLSYEFNYSGFYVYTAGSGNSAIEILKKDPQIDVILSDVRMKDGDGFALNSFIKENNINAQFYFMSADSNLTDEEISTLNLDGFFKKPFDFDYVVQTLSK